VTGPEPTGPERHPARDPIVLVPVAVDNQIRTWIFAELGINEPLRPATDAEVIAYL
jgi:hypothetical protein